MAKVYSWAITNTRYAYIVNPLDTSKAYIGAELTGDKLNVVADWTSNCTDEEYIVQFEKVKELCAKHGYNVEFENVSAYLHVESTCDNLRGPAGRGIEVISLTGEDTIANTATYTIFYTDGTTDTFTIKNGKDGTNGKDGIPGAKGDNGISSKLIMVYASGKDENENLIIPQRPQGGKYDFTSNKMTYPLGWEPSDDNLVPPVWMSSRTFTSTNTTTDKEWSLPIKITGENGLPGADGVSMEFIYKLTTIKPTEEEIANLESKNESGFVPADWTGSPCGVTEDNPTEWCCIRKNSKNENGIAQWGDWQGPTIWSQYGINGQDGDGIQYIYLKNNGELPSNPTPAGYNDYESNVYDSYQSKTSDWIPPTGITYTNAYGDEVIYMPTIDVTDNNSYANIWSDNPTDVTSQYQYQWVCSRKYITDGSGKKSWQAYSNPALWGKFGENGANATSIRKLYALSTSTSNPPTVPADSIITGDWGIGFPKDYISGENVVWGIEAEIWAHNNEFVKSYEIVSTKDANGNVIPPADANNINTKTDVTILPSTEIEGYKYIIYNGEYYAWQGGWSDPYIVTGLKGDKGDTGAVGPMGEKGEMGPAGMRGATGMPGASLNQMYCLGTYEEYFGGDNWKDSESGYGALPSNMIGWYDAENMPYSDIIDVITIQELEEETSKVSNCGRVIRYIENISTEVSGSVFYSTTHTYYLIKSDNTRELLVGPIDSNEEYNICLWCIQGADVWDDTSIDDGDSDSPQYAKVGVKWSKPFRLQGTNGLRGLTGARGQVVYPMGIYNNEEVYITTEEKAPYVYDPNDGMFYVYNETTLPWVGKLPANYETILNEDGTYKYSLDGTQGNWITDHNGDTPANNFANAEANGNASAWVRFESFEALYTSIGIIENGMIGSAVYNNEFMFSQQGIDQQSNKTTYATVSAGVTSYGFLSGYEYDKEGDENGYHWKYRGTTTYISDTDVDPYEKKDGVYIHDFMPNVCINFNTGEMWASCGKSHFAHNGSGYVADNAIKWWYDNNDKIAIQIGNDGEQGIKFIDNTLLIGPFDAYTTELENTVKEDIEQALTSTTTTVKDDIAKQIGYESYDDMVSTVEEKGNIIMKGGYLNADIISADVVDALRLSVEEAAIENLTTNTAWVKDLSVTKLNTKPETPNSTLGKIEIKDNEINVFNKTSDYSEVLSINGNSLTVIEPYKTLSTKIKNNTLIEGVTQGAGGDNSAQTEVVICEFTTPNENKYCDYNLLPNIYPGIDFFIPFDSDDLKGNEEQYIFDINVQYSLRLKGSNQNIGIIGKDNAHLIEFDDLEHTMKDNFEGTLSIEEVNTIFNLKAGKTYEVIATTTIINNSTRGSLSYTIETYGDITFKLEEAYSKLEIAADGFRYYINNYASFTCQKTDNHTLMVRIENSPDYSVDLSPTEGMSITYKGNKYKASVSGNELKFILNS